jgi:hypothetical protein
VPQGVLCESMFCTHSWSWVEITHLCHPLPNILVRYFFSPPRDPSPPSTFPLLRRPPHVNRGDGAALPSAGRPARLPETVKMSLPPPPPPPPLNSGRRVGLPRPPPLTLASSDGNGAAAARDEEENGAHGVVWEDSFAPFSQGFGAPGDLGDDEADDLATGATDGLATGTLLIGCNSKKRITHHTTPHTRTHSTQHTPRARTHACTQHPHTPRTQHPHTTHAHTGHPHTTHAHSTHTYTRMYTHKFF